MPVSGWELIGPLAEHIHPRAQIDPAAVVGPGASIGEEARIGPQAIVGRECRIGARTHLDARASIGDRGILEDFVRVASGVAIARDAVVGWGTQLGWLVRVKDAKDGQTSVDPPALENTSEYRPEASATARLGEKTTLIAEGALIAPGCVIASGVRIGRYAVVAAGSVVLDSVPDFHLAAGRPARPVGVVCRCGRMLTRLPPGEAAAISCPSCRQTYEICGQNIGELTPGGGGGDEAEPLFRDQTLALVGKCPPA